MYAKAVFHRAIHIGTVDGGGALRACGVAALTLALCACESHQFRTVDLTPPTRLDERVPEDELLDVGVRVFDPNVPADYDTAEAQLVNAEVRRIESYYMAYLLKSVVESTGNWGAVRVVPRRTHAVDVMITGTILESQGERLALTVRTRDATGRTWFHRTYQALASKYAYSESLPRGVDAFQQTYTAIADDMAAHFVELGPEERRRIRRSAEMQFARALVPDAYAGYVGADADGALVVRRLPARDDPLMQRVRRVRDREFLFIDTLEGYYGEYQRQIEPAYQNWRRAAYTESLAALKIREQRKRRRVAGVLGVVGGLAGGPATMGGVATGAELLADGFHRDHEAELHVEALREVSAAMEGEVAAHTLELENRTVRLSGSVDEQYARLRRILAESYRASIGLDSGG